MPATFDSRSTQVMHIAGGVMRLSHGEASRKEIFGCSQLSQFRGADSMDVDKLPALWPSPYSGEAEVGMVADAPYGCVGAWP